MSFQAASTHGKNFEALNRYMSLPQGDRIQAEYIWIGGSGSDLRSKTRTFANKIESIKDLPIWNFDGSSTGQADGHYSEVYLRPVKYIPDPFRRGNNVLVLCECCDPKTMKPIDSNTRHEAAKIFEQKEVAEEEPWYGIEQEYVLMNPDTNKPLGWPVNGFPEKQGKYYCANGTGKAIGRHIVEAHYRACLYCGLDISGVNGEVMPGQWEFQCGPCLGIDSGDQLWLMRFLLDRISEDFGVCCNYDPKPIKGDWNGSGCHTNYSTKSMREDKKNGFQNIIDAIERMGKVPELHMKEYSKVWEENKKRLTGKHETAKYDEFRYGVADRGASVRIPTQTEVDQCGYFEDRRPAADMDPYKVTAIIAKTTILGKNMYNNDDDDDMSFEEIEPSKTFDGKAQKELLAKVETISQLADEVTSVLAQFNTSDY